MIRVVPTENGFLGTSYDVITSCVIKFFAVADKTGIFQFFEGISAYSHHAGALFKIVSYCFELVQIDVLQLLQSSLDQWRGELIFWFGLLSWMNFAAEFYGSNSRGKIPYDSIGTPHGTLVIRSHARL
jgi:hypothetical protein